MEIHGGGRTIFNRSTSIGALPETSPSLVTDGYSILLEAKLGGGVVPPYILVLADLVGGTSPTVTLDAFLYFPYAKYLNKWQLIKRSTVSDDYTQSVTFMLVPTMGARRIDIKAQSSTGSPTDIRLHARAINDDQAYQLLEIEGGTGAAVTLSDIAPADVTEDPAAAGTSGEASRQDHKHYVDLSQAFRADAECLTGDAVGGLVYVRADISAGRYVVETADPTDFSKMPAVAMIIAKTSSTLCEIQFSGEVAGVYSGLTPGDVLYVGEDGNLATAPPAPTSSVKKYYQVAGVALASNVVGLSPDPIVVRRRL